MNNGIKNRVLHKVIIFFRTFVKVSLIFSLQSVNHRSVYGARGKGDPPKMFFFGRPPREIFPVLELLKPCRHVWNVQKCKWNFFESPLTPLPPLRSDHSADLWRECHVELSAASVPQETSQLTRSVVLLPTHSPNQSRLKKQKGGDSIVDKGFDG